MFVVDSVVRFSVNGSMVGSGRTTANIVDVWLEDAGGDEIRAQNVLTLAEKVLDSWDDNIRPKQVDELTLQSVSWVDLNDENGSTGTISTTASNTWPAAGGTAGEAVAFNTSILVRKAIVADRSRRQGRMYVPGIPEADVASGYTLTGTARPLWQAEFDDFFNDLQGTITNGGVPYDHYPAVVHVLTRDANENPLTGDSREVTAFSVQQVLATQRRRLRK